MSLWPDLSISDGTEEKDRFPRALESGYFLPDERRFEELLALGFELARTLPFHDLRNERNGTWGDLFTVNEAVVMAHILSTDAMRLEAEFAQQREMGVEQTVRFAYETARRIDFWLSTLGLPSSRAASELSERIEALVTERLADDLQELGGIVAVLREKTPSLDGLDFRGFHRLWGVSQADGGGRHAGGAARPRDASSGPMRDDVRRIFYAFLNVITHLRSIVRPYLAESMQSQTHDPAVALFIVFLKLLESARGRLNSFAERHLDFYYRRVLGATARPHEPDHVFLSLQIADGQSQVQIPAATEFLTAAGAGPAEIVFLNERDSVVSDAKVDTLCTLRFERDRFISPERELGQVTRVKALQRTLGGKDESGVAVNDWPLFGTSSRLVGHESALDARVGFAVASPVLLLREGLRTVEIQIELGQRGAPSGSAHQILDPEKKGNARPSAVLAEIFAQYLAAEWDLFDSAAGADVAQEAALLVLLVEPEIARADAGDWKRRTFVYGLFLKALLRQPIGSAEVLFRVFGKIFRHYVLDTAVRLDEAFKREILERASDVLDADSRQVIERLLNQSREVIFQTLLRGVFDIALTVPSGWHSVEKYVMTHLESGAQGARNGLRFVLTLGPEVESIVSYSPETHGGQWSGTAPLIRFQLNSRANFCAYSLLNATQLEAVAIDVHVRGLRDLKLYNNVGRLDPSKPFQPFGPLPTLSSYFVFGSYEMAQKQLTGLTVNLDWADLPTGFGGFAAHYAEYERGYADDNFRVDLSVLRDGVWQPQADRERPTAALFQPAGPTDKLKSARSINIGLAELSRPVDSRIPEEQFDLQQRVRNGFFRLGLVAPEGAFGHADYPLLLSKALSENIRSKKVFKQLPSAPYTPLISRISVNYSARARIRVDETRSGGRSGRDQRIFHLHPFGYEEVQPVRAGKAYSLLPKYDTDGNLFIGFTGGLGARTLALLFHLTEDTSQQATFENPEIAWYYLSGAGWRRLPATSIVLDTTNGFLCSGVVTLVLPEDLDRQSSLMPSGKAWLRVGASAWLDSFPRLFSVSANGIRACRRVDAAAGEILIEHVPSGSAWRSATAFPGLGEIVQVGPSFGGVPTENRRRFLTRISERLRHKNRAITDWDFERLVLQQFPDVFKVKCFAGLAPPDTRPKPGNVLLVVVAHADRESGLECQRPMLDVLQLEEIRRFVQRLSSPFVQVEVRNPSYERVQVRCKAKFVDDAHPGFYIRKLNREVSEFLCPWVPFGYRARFGWMITREDVEGFIRGRDYVHFVTDFSMLHIAEDDQDTYTLADTVSRNLVDQPDGETGPSGGPAFRRSDRVRWRYPWSLAVPMERHFIEALRVTRPIEPEPAGITELDIGGTFIIGGTD